MTVKTNAILPETNPQRAAFQFLYTNPNVQKIESPTIVPITAKVMRARNQQTLGGAMFIA